MKSLKYNKSPGPDGYIPEFYKYFWPELGHLFLEFKNFSQVKGCLTNTILEGTITCLPKPGESRNLIKNWRPISLLNTSYKLISTCITNRLRPLLKTLISQEQKGFLEGRSINECTRLMYDIITGCENFNVDGLILLVDFEKAFGEFNFGTNFTSWINMYQTGSSSKITLNGHFSSSFTLQRGCRQGDPILTLAFKANKKLEGIKLLDKEHKLCQYADDT